MLLLSSIPGLISTVLRFTVDESPRFLIVKGRRIDAVNVLKTVASYNNIDLGKFELSVDPAVAKQAEMSFTGSSIVSQFKDLMSPELRFTSVLLWMIVS